MSSKYDKHQNGLLLDNTAGRANTLQTYRPFLPVRNDALLEREMHSIDNEPIETPYVVELKDTQLSNETLPPPSRSFSEDSACRICQEDGSKEDLISPCLCSGTMAHVHFSCLEKWLNLTSRSHCELCGFRFPVIKKCPSLWDHFRHPMENTDFAHIVCDIICFVVLTPLLIASAYLCALGAKHYILAKKTGSVFAILTLVLFLALVYAAWACLVTMYHYRNYRFWRDRHCSVTVSLDQFKNMEPVQSVNLCKTTTGSSNQDPPCLDIQQTSKSPSDHAPAPLRPSHKQAAWFKPANRVQDS